MSMKGQIKSAMVGTIESMAFEEIGSFGYAVSYRG